jgi:carbon storage regulator
MLYLTRKIGETIIINDQIKLVVIAISGKTVKLGFEYPDHVTVLREEIYERIKKENETALKDAQSILENAHDYE